MVKRQFLYGVIITIKDVIELIIHSEKHTPMVIRHTKVNIHIALWVPRGYTDTNRRELKCCTELRYTCILRLITGNHPVVAVGVLSGELSTNVLESLWDRARRLELFEGRR